MKVEILEGAAEDLVEGFRFYEQQQEGLGAYLPPRSRLDSRKIEVTSDCRPPISAFCFLLSAFVLWFLSPLV